MKNLILVAALMVAPFATAHELDEPGQVTTPAQIEKAKDLPGTTVIRVKKDDPSQIEVLYTKEKLAAGTDVSKMKFEKVALNAEKIGIAYDAKSELDATSSTSSWSFWYGNRYPGYRPAYAAAYGYRPYYGNYGYRPYYGSYYNPYASNYYAPYNSGYYPYGGNGCGQVSACSYPSYAYAGYNYAYSPYYNCADPYYSYTYYSWSY